MIFDLTKRKSGGGETAIKGISTIGISSIPNGGATAVQATFPDLLFIRLPTEAETTVTTVDIISNVTDEITVASACTSSRNGGALKTVNLHMHKALIPSNEYGLRYRVNLEEVIAKVRVAQTNTSNQFTGASKLKTIYWQENAQTISVNISACPLTDESLVSLANGLNGETTATVTLSSTRKTMCTTIMGTVSQVTESNTTYDLFTADPNGTVTLTEFITITKGWTIA